jgi:carbon-monoxide dehydrogenase medium subunit
VKPTAFSYHSPETVDEALALLADLGDDAAPLSGGQSLVPMMNLRLAQIGHIIDLNGLSELASVNEQDGTLRIGALTRQRTLERHQDLSRLSPLLAQAVPEIAHPSIRVRGTIGGSVAHADPSAELATAMVAADASVVLARRDGSRVVPARDFFKGPYFTVREADELLVSVEMPLPRRDERAVFMELSRKPGDFALVLVAVVLQVKDGLLTGARIGVGGAGPRPVRASAAEQMLSGSELGQAALHAEAAAEAANEVEVSGDVHGSESYRRRMVGVLVRRALERAVERPSEGYDA